MHLFSFSQAASLLVAYLGVAHAAAAGKPSSPSSSSGVAEVDLVFPRPNQTFAPTSRFPIIFAFQDTELAPALDMWIEIGVWKQNREFGLDLKDDHQMRLVNFSGRDPYFAYRYYQDKFNIEANWTMRWTLAWHSCTEESLSLTNSTNDRQIMFNRTDREISFSTSNSAPEIDLVAATDDKDCSKNLGVALNVTRTLTVPDGVYPWNGGEMCAVLASTSTATPEPCRVKINSSAASSMVASWTSLACTHPKAIDCPQPEDAEEKSAAQQLAVGGVACLAAAIGVMSYMVTMMM